MEWWITSLVHQENLIISRKWDSFFFNGFGEISIFKLVQDDFTKKMLKGLT